MLGQILAFWFTFRMISKSCSLLYKLHYVQKISAGISLCYFEKCLLTYFARHEAAHLDSVRLLVQGQHEEESTSDPSECRVTFYVQHTAFCYFQGQFIQSTCDIYLSFNKIDLRREGSLNGHSIFKIIHSSIFVSLVLWCPYNNEPLIQVELKSLSFLLTRYKIQSDI